MEQSYPRDKYEIIVVNDGSNDRTEEIVKGFNVVYIFQENCGPATARNKGAMAAKGNIILFTDSDCVPNRDWIKEMVFPFEDDEVVAVKGAYRTDQPEITARFAQIEFNERYRLLLRNRYTDMVDTYSAGYRRDVFLSLGGFDPSFPIANNEDTELSYKMSQRGYKMVFNPKAVVYHLGHPDSLTKYAKLKFWRGYWRMVVYKRYPTKMLKDSYTPQTLKLQIVFFYLSLMSLIFVGIYPALMLYPLIFGIISFGVVSLPFTIWALMVNPLIGILSPFFLILRAASLGLGMVWSVVKHRDDFLKNRSHRSPC